MSDIDTTAPITESADDSGSEPDFNLDTGEAIHEETETVETSTDNEEADSTPSEEEAAGEQETDEAEADPADEEQSEEAGDDTTDVSKMTRAERRDYYQSLRQQRESETSQAVSAVYQPQGLDELKNAYLNEKDEYGNPLYDDFQATMLARDTMREQQAQIAQASVEIAQLNSSIEVDAVEARAKYDWMNPAKTDSFDKGMAETAAKIFSQGITTDPRTGQIIEARMTPSQAADIVNQIYENGTKKGSIKAQKAAEQQMAAVAPPTSTRQPVKRGNTLSEMEDRLKNIEF